MAIEIRINKDVGSYQAKFIGPFTMRQTICIVAAAPVCWGIYFGLSPILTTEVAGFLVFIPATIAALFGWVKPFGMPMERFLKSVCITLFLAPACRKYITVNRHESALAALASVSPDTPAKKKRHKKYKVSKEAVK